MQTSRQRATGVLALALLLSIAASGVARAGSYTVGACGTSGAALTATGGAWIPAQTSTDLAVYGACPAIPNGEGMVVRHVYTKSSVPNGAFAKLSFIAPAGTTITAINANGMMIGASGWHVALVGSANGNIFSSDHGYGEFSHAWALKPSTWVMWYVQCATSPRCPITTAWSAPYIQVSSAAVTINDPTAPALTPTTAANPAAPHGSAWSGAWVAGNQPIAAAASDNTGIHAATLTIYRPGAAPLSYPATYGCNYAHATPCGNQSPSFNIPTASVLSDGAYAASLTVTDAAGNATAKSTTLRIDNHPVAPPKNIQLLGARTGDSTTDSTSPGRTRRPTAARRSPAPATSSARPARTPDASKATRRARGSTRSTASACPTPGRGRRGCGCATRPATQTTDGTPTP